jgi:predicted dehydrogenase
LGHLFEIHDFVDCVAEGRTLQRITPEASLLAVETVREELRQIEEKSRSK